MARSSDHVAAPETGQPAGSRKVARLEKDLEAAVAKEEKRRRQLVKAGGRPKRERRRTKQLAKASGRLSDLRSKLAQALDTVAEPPTDAEGPSTSAALAPAPARKPAALTTRPAAARNVAKPGRRPAAATATPAGPSKATTDRAATAASGKPASGKPASGRAARTTPRASTPSTSGSTKPRRRRTPGQAPPA